MNDINAALCMKYLDEPDKIEPDTEIDERQAPQSALFFCDAMSALAAALPAGGSLRLVGFERADVFLRAGYRLTDGDADVCIARGGMREFAAARKVPCGKLILAPTHAHFAAAASKYRAEDNGFAVTRTGQTPFAVAFDPADADENLASLFGEIASLDLAAFDLTFASYMRGQRLESSVASDVAELISELTAELKSIEKQRDKTKHALVKAGERAARLTAQTPDLLFSSGAAQAAEAYRMLCIAEDRAAGMRGETEMILGGYVIDYYIKSLSSDSFDFPPDNNKRMESLCEYFNADPRRACLYTTPIMPPQKLKLYEYRVREFKAELLSMLGEINKRRFAAWQTFKRLYPDDGFCIKSLVDKTDVALCVALAPDVLTADSLLSFFKQAGRLEKYIV